MVKWQTSLTGYTELQQTLNVIEKAYKLIGEPKIKILSHDIIIVIWKFYEKDKK